MKRKIIIVVSTVLILAAGVLVRKQLAADRKPAPRTPATTVAVAFVQQVKNGPVSTSVGATGSLMAKNRFEVFAEVQGIMLNDGGAFKAGNSFSAGQQLIGLRSDDFKAGLVAQRSAFHSRLAGVLPDFKMDFPGSHDRWAKYVLAFDPHKFIGELPVPADDREKLFVTGRGIFTEYFNLKNAELTLGKYSIVAPFSGVVTKSMVTPGTVVRPGQKLGEFIDPGVFEIEAAVTGSLAATLRTGQKVTVNLSQGAARQLTGEVVRINKSVDSGTQTVSVFVRVSGEGLDEGRFAEVLIPGADLENAFEINRSALMEEDRVYTVRDSLLVPVVVEPLFFKEKTVVVRGLTDNEQVLLRPVPGAYPGMKVAATTE